MTDATDGDDTLRLIEDAARGFAAFDAKRIRGWRQAEPGFDRKVWKSMAEQGWISILFSEEAGGLGLGIDAAVTVARQLGHGCYPEPFVAAGVVAPALISRLGPAKLGADTVNAIIAGDHIACLAWQNAAGSLSPIDTEITVQQNNGQHVLSGESRFVPVADADTFLVTGNVDGELAVYAVPATTEGVMCKSEPLADGGFWGWLTLTNVALPEAACLAKGVAAKEAINEAIELGLLANSAELTGIMERSLELTLEYLKTRKQFGQTIGSFQVLQHRAVDMWMKLQLTKHTLDAAIKNAMAPDFSAQARAISASSVKSRAAAVALKMANECVQLHGAIGFTDEYDLGLYVNRTLTIVPFLGNAAEHRRRYGELKQRARASA